MKRIVIVGVPSCGKTTLARQLSKTLDIPHQELDAHYWKTGWLESHPEDFRKHIESIASGDAWVMDGNYKWVRDIIWGRADTLVWIDYPLLLVMRWHFIRRIKRWLLREHLWGDHQENLKSFTAQTFANKRTYIPLVYRRYRQAYPILLRKPEYAHLKVVHILSPKQTEKWLQDLKSEYTAPKISLPDSLTQGHLI